MATPTVVRKTKPKATFSAAPAQIWKSRLSWKIAANVFLTILIVQGAILYVGIREFESSKLEQLRTIAESTVAPLLKTDNVNSATLSVTSPFERSEIISLINKTKINGIAVYGPDLLAKGGSNRLVLVDTYGAYVRANLRTTEEMYNIPNAYNGTSYEIAFNTSRMGTSLPYIVVVNIDSSHIPDQLVAFFWDNVKIIALLSAFVTSVLMLTLWRLLLEPMLFMRRSLVEASKNPENPAVDESPFKADDEIGNAIQLSQNLIRQNAQNLKQIKSAAEDQIHKLAYYDTLTGLPNRTLFLQSLKEKMEPTNDGDTAPPLAVITIDLDHFKDINDSMGHNVGDAILRGVGKRLRSALPESAIVSRSGEDEFAIAMPLTSNTKAREVGERVIGVIRAKPFEVFSEQFQVRASLGVATFPQDGHEPDQVLKNADIALNRSKEEGRDTIKEYSEDFDRAVQARFQLLRDLRDALEHNQLKAYYQPQFDLNTGKIIGAEALLRWWKPDNSREGGSYISPAEFIPVAEQSGLIVPIGEQVMRNSCFLVKQWNDKYNANMRIAVNVSGVQFSQGNLVEFVAKTLKETGLEAKFLELEVTESIFMDDIHHTIQTLKNLHALGIELAIDDFGTGYSSLSYLRQFPIDRLKIDQSFIRNALNDPDDASIARTIIALGRALSLKVIAEGVETREHEDFLKDFGCDEVQGYRYSKALPADEFEAFLTKYNGDLNSFNS